MTECELVATKYDPKLNYFVQSDIIAETIQSGQNGSEQM